MTDKLKPGYHYAIVNDCEAIFEKYKGLKYPYCHGNCCTEYKYLAPVPSYDEWKAKLEENAQLKELLKRCRDKLFEIYSDEVSHPEAVPIIKKLDEVLKD